MDDKKIFCNICQKKIETKSERYCNIIDYECKKEKRNEWYHFSCWKEKLGIGKSRLNKFDRFMDKADLLLENLTGTKEVYNIR